MKTIHDIIKSNLNRLIEKMVEKLQNLEPKTRIKLAKCCNFTCFFLITAVFWMLMLILTGPDFSLEQSKFWIALAVAETLTILAVLAVLAPKNEE